MLNRQVCIVVSTPAIIMGDTRVVCNSYGNKEMNYDHKPLVRHVNRMDIKRGMQYDNTNLVETNEPIIVPVCIFSSSSIHSELELEKKEKDMNNPKRSSPPSSQQ